MKKHFLSGLSKRRAKQVLTLAVVLVVILGTTLYILVLGINRGAQDSLANINDEVSRQTFDFNTKLADVTVPSGDKIALVKDYGNKISASADRLCAGQEGRIYSALISTLDRCRRAEAKLRVAAELVDSIHRYLKSDLALASAIPAGLNDLTPSQSYEAWDSALVAISAVDAPSELVDQKIALIKSVTGYRDAWRALVDADSAHNELAFVAAQDLLSKNYQTLLDSVQNKPTPLQGLSIKLAAQLNGFYEESKAP